MAILLINPIEMLGGGRLRLCLGQNFVSAFHFMDLTFLNIDDNENIYLTENMDSLVIKAMYSTYRSKLSHFKNNPVCFWLDVEGEMRMFYFSIHLTSVLLIYKPSKNAEDHLCQS